MMAALLTPAQLDRANAILGDWLADRIEVELGDAARALDQPHHALGFAITRRLVSTLLRKRSFTKFGIAGSGYDRDTLYRKANA